MPIVDFKEELPNYKIFGPFVSLWKTLSSQHETCNYIPHFLNLGEVGISSICRSSSVIGNWCTWAAAPRYFYCVSFPSKVTVCVLFL